MAEALVIGSRGSQLALWQARWIQERLAGMGVESRIEIIRTTGDRITDVPLAKVGGKGLFTKEIEDALLDGRIDCAVHSLKDLPTELPPGLTVAATPEREVPNDALVGATLDTLPEGARVGTSSLRRAAQLRATRPDLVIEPVRGNLDTRLRKLDEGQYDAIVLAAAGLRRLGWGGRIGQLLPPGLMIPAAGQGALAVETRDDGGPAWQHCTRLHDRDTGIAVNVERAVLGRLGGGCQVPIGAYAQVRGGEVAVEAVVISPNGETVVRESARAPVEEAGQLGERVAKALLESGGAAVLRQVYTPLAGQRIIVTRASRQAGGLSERLRGLGASVVEMPVIDIAAPADEAPLKDAIAAIDSYDWIIFTSVNGVEFFFGRLTAGAQIRARICAIGPATRAALAQRGVEVSLIPDEYVAESVVAAFAGTGIAGKRVLLPRAAVARDVIPDELRKLGAVVDVVEAYRNVVPAGLAEQARSVFGGPSKPDWVTLTSSSTVKNLLAAAGAESLAGVKLASIGPVTSQVARMHGLDIAAEATPYTIEGLVEAIRQHCR